MGIGSIGGSYLNFTLGTGNEDIATMITRQVRNRKVNGQNYLTALYKGTKKGIVYSHKKSIKNGGFLKSLKKGFGEIPNGWKNGKGFFGKPWGAIKGIGKAMPALFAFITIAGEIPNLYKAVKEKGVVQGLKETGKTAARLTTGALFAALGTAILSPIPVVGSIAGGMAGYYVGDWLATKIVGKSYSEKAEEQAENKDETQASNENAQQPAVADASGAVVGADITVPPATTNVGGGYVQYPSIDINDFGPHRPYANIFFNNPAAYADMGYRMPGQEGLSGYAVASGMYPMMMGGVNNSSGNLLEQNGGNLLTPTGTQNAYSRVQNQKQEQGSKLNLVSE